MIHVFRLWTSIVAISKPLSIQSIIFIGRILGGQGGLSPHFTNWGTWPPALQRRQLYTWVGESQYSVKMLHCVNSPVAAISIYTN